MLTSKFKKKLAYAASAVAALGAVVAVGLAGSSPANADPKQFSALVGFGSDTTQDVLNALSGHSNGVNYPPAQSSAASGRRQLVSWDAFPQNQCIQTRAGSGSILRPNGSTNGLRVLSRAYAGGTWNSPLCGNKSTAGLVHFARSSSRPATLGSDLVYIPFGRDAVSFAYNRPAGSPVTNLTTAQLGSLFGTGPQEIGGVVIIPCGIQTGSGTYATWNGMIGLGTTGTPDNGTGFCNTTLAPGGVPDGQGRLQEHNGPQLTVKANALATTSDPICDGTPGGAPVSCANAQVIVGFSASQFIARSNNVASPNPGPGVGLGSVNGLAAVSGTAPNLTPSTALYSDTTFGRDVFNVVPAEVIDDFGAQDVQTMFVGPTSAVCSATSTIQQFGFLSLGANCGTTTLRGIFVS